MIQNQPVITNGKNMVFLHILLHGLFYVLIVNGSLFFIMITVSPRVWGLQDYPEMIQNKVPQRTKNEKLIAAIIGIPWIIFFLGYPIYSTYSLEFKLGVDIPLLIAFLNSFVLFMLANAGDLVILDWLIIGKITPQFVIIPGTKKEDYEDFSHHYKAHAKSVLVLIILSFLIACFVRYF